MTRTTGRTLELLGLLQTHRTWTGPELRSRLEVSERTLRRDVDDLRGLGYGIESVPGVGGGYRLGAGASIPPLVLSADEAVAIAIGLRAAGQAAVTGMEDASARALSKLEQSLSSQTRERIATVERAVVPLGGASADVDMDVVVAVAGAIRESRRMRIHYRTHEGAESRRRIEPHRIVHSGRRWYLLAWDIDRNDWRNLRLDRLVPRLPLDATFVPRDLPDDQVRAFTTHGITTAPYPVQARLRVHAPADDVRRHFGPTVAHVQVESASTCLLSVGSRGAAEMAMYVGTSGFAFEVLDGAELRQALTDLAARFTRAIRPVGSPAPRHVIDVDFDPQRKSDE